LKTDFGDSGDGISGDNDDFYEFEVMTSF